MGTSMSIYPRLLVRVLTRTEVTCFKQLLPLNLWAVGDPDTSCSFGVPGQQCVLSSAVIQLTR